MAAAPEFVSLLNRSGETRAVSRSMALPPPYPSPGAQQWRSLLERSTARSGNYNREDHQEAFWEKVLHLLGTGNYATAGLAIGLVRGDPDLWSNIVQGVRNRTTYSEVLTEAGMTQRPGKIDPADVLGLVGDIFLDPVTYLMPFGATAKGVAAVGTRQAAKQLVRDDKILLKAGEFLTKQGKKIETAEELLEFAGPEASKLRAAIQEGIRRGVSLKKPSFVGEFDEGERALLAVVSPFTTPTLLRPKHVTGMMQAIGFPGSSMMHKIAQEAPLGIPIMGFKETGLRVPIPTQVERAVASGLVGAGEFLRGAPGVAQAARLFNTRFRPPNTDPQLFDAAMEIADKYKGIAHGETHRFLEQLRDIATTGGMPRWAKMAGIPEHSFFGTILKETGRRVMDPEDAVKIAHVLDDLARGIEMDPNSVRILDNLIQRTVGSIDPEKIAMLRASNPGAVDDVLRFLEDRVGAIQEELKLIYAGERQGDEAFIKRLNDEIAEIGEKQRVILEGGGATPTVKPEAPFQQAARGVEPPPSPPQAESGLRMAGYGTVGAALEVRGRLFNDFQAKNAARLKLAEQLQQGAFTDPATVAAARQRITKLRSDLRREKVKIDAIDFRIRNAATKAEAQSVAKQRLAKSVQEGLSQARTEPWAKQLASEVIPEAANDAARLQVRLEQRIEDVAERARLQQKLDMTVEETVAQRAARIARETGQGPERELELLDQYRKQAGFTRLEEADQVRKQVSGEAGQLDLIDPPLQPRPLVQDAAAVTGYNLEELARIARNSTPDDFNEFLARRLAYLEDRPDDIGALSRQAPGAMEHVNSRTGELYEQLRSLPQARMEGARFGVKSTDAPVKMWQRSVGASIQAESDNIRKLHPTLTFEATEPVVVGKWAAETASDWRDPVLMVSFVKGEERAVEVLRSGFRGEVPLEGSTAPGRVIFWRLAPGQKEEEVVRAMTRATAPPNLIRDASEARTRERQFNNIWRVLRTQGSRLRSPDLKQVQQGVDAWVDTTREAMRDLNGRQLTTQGQTKLYRSMLRFEERAPSPLTFDGPDYEGIASAVRGKEVRFRNPKGRPRHPERAGGLPDEAAIRAREAKNGRQPEIDRPIRVEDVEETVREGRSLSQKILRLFQDSNGRVSSKMPQRMREFFTGNPDYAEYWARETAQELVRLDPSAVDRVTQLQDLLDAFIRVERSEGVMTGYLASYLPRVVKEGKDKSKFIRYVLGNVPEPSFVQPRTIQGHFAEINRIYREAGYDEPYELNLWAMIAGRGKASIQAGTAIKYQKELAATFGTVVSVEGDDIISSYANVLRKHNAGDDLVALVQDKIDELHRVGGRTKSERLTRVQELIEAGDFGKAQYIRGLEEGLHQALPDMELVIPRGMLQNVDMEGIAARGYAGSVQLTDEQKRAILDLASLKAEDGSNFYRVPAHKREALMHAKDLGIEGYWMPKEVVDTLQRINANTIDMGDDVNHFLRLFDKTQGWFKAWTLGIFPIYHTRNAIGNMWNAYLAGLDDPEFYELAFKFQSGKLDAWQDEWGRKWTQQEIERQLKDTGTLGRGLRDAEDISAAIEHNYAKDWPSLLKYLPLMPSPQRSKLARIGFQVAELVEDNARVALFLDGLNRGMDPLDAGRRVKKYLFDYDDLTDFERKFMRRLAPFYTWTRKNLPLQLRSLLTRPAKFIGVTKTTRFVENTFTTPPPDEQYLPEWMQDAYPVRVAQTGPRQYLYFMMGGWLPAGDLVKASDPVSLAFGMLTPFAKAPIEYFANYSLFFKDRIERYPEETGEFLGWRMRRRDINLIRNIRFFNQVDKAVFADDTDASAKIIQQVAGRLYPVDYDQQVFFRRFEVARELNALETAMRKEMAKQMEDIRAAKGVRNGRQIEAIRESIVELEREQARIGRPVTRPRRFGAGPQGPRGPGGSR